MEIIFVGSYLMCLFTSFYICQFVDVVFIYYHDMDDINLIWMQRNPNAKEMRNKSFPFYDEHLLIFWKGSCNRGAKTLPDVVEKLYAEEANRNFYIGWN